MTKHYCDVCGTEVTSLHELVDLTSSLSSRNRDEWSDAGFKQDHVCKQCVKAIQRFIKGLRVREAAPEMAARVQ